MLGEWVSGSGARCGLRGFGGAQDLGTGVASASPRAILIPDLGQDSRVSERERLHVRTGGNVSGGHQNLSDPTDAAGIRPTSLREESGSGLPDANQNEKRTREECEPAAFLPKLANSGSQSRRRGGRPKISTPRGGSRLRSLL